MSSKKQLTLKGIINRIKGDLPPLPTTITEIMKVTSDPYATAKDIGQVIEKDQAMAAKVLRLANSAYYGFAHKIKTIV